MAEVDNFRGKSGTDAKAITLQCRSVRSLIGQVVLRFMRVENLRLRQNTLLWFAAEDVGSDDTCLRHSACKFVGC